MYTYYLPLYERIIYSVDHEETTNTFPYLFNNRNVQGYKYQVCVKSIYKGDFLWGGGSMSEGKPSRIRRLCLKTSEVVGA